MYRAVIEKLNITDPSLYIITRVDREKTITVELTNAGSKRSSE
jgi:hypothetical protein